LDRRDRRFFSPLEAAAHGPFGALCKHLQPGSTGWNADDKNVANFFNTESRTWSGFCDSDAYRR
jgi:hypothetical protein